MYGTAGPVIRFAAGMENLDNETLARLCRVQAGLASTAESRSALLELARVYERAEPEGSVLEASVLETGVVADSKQPE